MRGELPTQLATSRAIFLLI
jgi:hypothetical protein